MKTLDAPSERSELPASVLRFIKNHIHSVEQLEVLLLLQKTADKEWTAEEVNHLLKSDLISVGQRLNDLYSRKFLMQRQEGEKIFFRFNLDSSTNASVEEVGECYKVFAIRIIEAIYLKPDESMKEFATAFKIRKD
ncbi:MAG: hypothetical protein EOP04_01110 [Proteobacteria bacterium]|nr:MAG: hypothetical protein EOP04_01110 [Pseudomonadota bacterium]